MSDCLTLAGSVGDRHASGWRRTLLPSTSSVQEAIRNLNESALKIAVLVTPDDCLLGTITDGDIRRGLLRGIDLLGPAAEVAKRDALVVPPEVSREMVLRLMQINGFDAIPIVDGQRRVVGLHLLNELLTPPARANSFVIMAGGRGARLGPRTENCPKPLLPVAGKPMLEHIIEAARAEGFRRFVLAIHYLGHMIEEYFRDGQQWNVHIDYLREEAPLGTAGALAMLDPRPECPFVITNGDVLTDVRYAELLDFHVRHHAAATMAVRLHEWQHPYGVVHIEGVDFVSMEEKPVARTHINAGIYVLNPHVVDAMSIGEHLDMPSLFSRLKAQAARTIVYPMHEPWLDVGRVEDLVQADHRGSES